MGSAAKAASNGEPQGGIKPFSALSRQVGIESGTIKYTGNNVFLYVDELLLPSSSPSPIWGGETRNMAALP
jgi:hypothetical protein